jgi:hypothetical protein
MTKLCKLCKNLIITLVFDENANFSPKIAKNPENCDHKIRPRLLDFSPIARSYTLASFFEKYNSSHPFWATFFNGKSYALILTKNELGDILGDFLTNSSGHPGRK